MLKKNEIRIVLFFTCMVAIGMVLKLVSNLELKEFKYIEYPLQIINNICQDEQGNIYVGLDANSRVQVYTIDGKFKYGWFIDTDFGGGWSLKIDDNDVIHTFGSFIYSQYNVLGELLQKQEDVDIGFSGYFNKIKLHREYNNCSSLEVSRDKMYNYVIIDKKSGRSIIKTPWYWFPITVPFPAVLYVVCSFILLILRTFLPAKEKKSNRSS